jgi:hypothetical protein
MGGIMTQSLTPFDPLLVNIVLGTLAIGLPIVMVLAIRFLWDRNLNVAPSKQFEKLIWQLHRIASALEHQMNLSFPAVQPGTEEAHDLAYLERTVVPSNASTQSVASANAAAAGAPARSGAAPSTAPVSVKPPVTPQPVTPQPAAQQASVPPSVPREVTDDVPRRAGVNSMFGL